MRHGKKFNHLGRTKSHRKAMLSNMACSLIQNKRINTTLAKAKALRGYVEPLITKSKDDSTHSRRVVFGHLNDKYAVTELFRDVAPKIANRAGGYTRIIRTGNRLGDNAEMCMMELVDYNEIYGNETAAPKKKARRSRRGGGSTSNTESTETSAETKETTAEKSTAKKTTEAKSAEVKEEAKPKAKATEKKVEEKSPKTDKAEEKKAPKVEAKKDATKEAPKKEEGKSDKND